MSSGIMFYSKPGESTIELEKFFDKLGLTWWCGDKFGEEVFEDGSKSTWGGGFDFFDGYKILYYDGTGFSTQEYDVFDESSGYSLDGVYNTISLKKYGTVTARNAIIGQVKEKGLWVINVGIFNLNYCFKTKADALRWCPVEL